MAVVALVKVTLFGPSSERDAVLDGLQELGCLHLVDLRPPTAHASPVATQDADTREAWQYLHDSPVRRPALRRAADVDLGAVTREALELRQRAELLSDELAPLRKHVAELEPWGDFVLPEWAKGGALRFWFHVVPLAELARVEALELPWRIVARDHRFARVVVVAAEPPAALPAPVALPGESLAVLRARLEQIERELEEIDYRRIGLTLHRDLLASSLDAADDRVAREGAAIVSLDEDHVFAVQGWIPRTRAQELRRFAADRELAVTIASPGPDDAPPTLLDNPAALRGGEGMVTFYKVPAYSAWDPSTTVFFSFALFFAMIFSDAGYGAVMGIFVLAKWKRLGQSAGGLRGVLVALVLASIVYGVLAGSYFGVVPPPDSLLGRLHVLDIEDQSLMMLISVGIGAAHLAYANLASAWRERRSLVALHGVGWAGIILGAFCAGLGQSDPRLAALSKGGVIALATGAGLVLLFTSKRPFGLAPRLLFGRLADGVMGLLELSKAFGDVLSYLRLFALGLAAVKLAEAFNHLAGEASAGAGAGVVLALLILVAGHAINFALGIMGGVVHGLRLNVIEFFNWSLHEEGEAFRAFSKKAAD